MYTTLHCRVHPTYCAQHDIIEGLKIVNGPYNSILRAGHIFSEQDFTRQGAYYYAKTIVQLQVLASRKQSV